MNICQDNKKLLIIAREVLNGKTTSEVRPGPDKNGTEAAAKTENQNEITK